MRVSSFCLFFYILKKFDFDLISKGFTLGCTEVGNHLFYSLDTFKHQKLLLLDLGEDHNFCVVMSCDDGYVRPT